MKTKQFITPRSTRSIGQKYNARLSQQAFRGLSNPLILILGLMMAVSLSGSYFYLLIIIQSGY